MNTTQHLDVPTSLLETYLVNFLSVVTSTIIYHPLRTTATRIVGKKSLSLSPTVLYRGWSFCLLASHQFFLMGACKDQLEKRLKCNYELSLLEKSAIGAFSGFITTLTVTPCEAMTTQRQLGKSIDWKDRNLYHRGIVPICIRQIGLGLGMFVLPDLIASKLPPKSQNNETLKPVINFFAGSFAAMMTHTSEHSRLLMQIDPENHRTARAAFKSAWKQIFSSESIKLFKIRVTVIGIATATMQIGKKTFSEIISGNRD